MTPTNGDVMSENFSRRDFFGRTASAGVGAAVVVTGAANVAAAPIVPKVVASQSIVVGSTLGPVQVLNFCHTGTLQDSIRAFIGKHPGDI